MKKYLKISLVVIFLFSFVLAPNLVKAQTESGSTSECIDLKNNLKFGDRDINKKGEVTILQKYLKFQGYLSIAPSGYFGTSTLKAVLNFQKANNIKPALGFVGSLTKEKIKDLSCEEVLGESCLNGIQDGDETGIDQGGNCTTITASCFNGIQDGDETGIDTGGSCVKSCPEGMTGTWPNCVITQTCPNGTTGTWPNCKFTEIPCGVGFTGVSPNCVPLEPVISFNSSSESIESSKNISLSWYSENATSCVASEGWAGSKAKSGVQIISNLKTTTQFTLTCSGAGGTKSATVQVAVYVVDDFSSMTLLSPNGGESYTVGQQIKVLWKSENIPITNNLVSILLHPYKSGQKVDTTIGLSVFTLNDGEEIVTLPPSTFVLQNLGNNFKISIGTVGSNNNSLGLDFSDNYFIITNPKICPEGYVGTYPNCYPIPPTASLVFTANPTNLYFGGQTNLSWKATGVSLCEASGAWTGSKDEEDNLTINIDFLGSKTYTLTCKNQGGPLLVEKSVTITATQNPNYLPGCASNNGYSMTTGQSCNITVINPLVTNTASLDLTPRVSIWGTKLSQYLNDKGFWVTDLNSGYVHTNEILRFCKKWYPTTTSLEYYKEEYIPNWINLSTGANETFYSNHFSYKCVGGAHSGPSKVLGIETTSISNSCTLSKNLMKGIDNQEVKCLQKKLNEKGYQVKGTENSKEITFFGYNTELALKKFQRANSLIADGILGFNTLKLLNQ